LRFALQVPISDCVPGVEVGFFPQSLTKVFLSNLRIGVAMVDNYCSCGQNEFSWTEKRNLESSGLTGSRINK
jgi:hypothetical protein